MKPAGSSRPEPLTYLQERDNQRRHDHPLDVFLQQLNYDVVATLKTSNRRSRRVQKTSRKARNGDANRKEATSTSWCTADLSVILFLPQSLATVTQHESGTEFPSSAKLLQSEELFMPQHFSWGGDSNRRDPTAPAAQSPPPPPVLHLRPPASCPQSS